MKLTAQSEQPTPRSASWRRPTVVKGPWAQGRLGHGLYACVSLGLRESKDVRFHKSDRGKRLKRFKICALPSVKMSFMKYKKQTKSSTYSFLPNKYRNLFCNPSSRPNSRLFIKRKNKPSATILRGP